MRKELKWFAERMEDRLDLYQFQRDWEGATTFELLVALQDRVVELKEALINGDIKRITKEAAELANFAMMIDANKRRQERNKGDT